MTAQATPVTLNIEGEDRLLSVQDLATRFQVPIATCYDWRSRHKGPRGIRIGRYVRYRLSDVLAFEEANADELPRR